MRGLGSIGWLAATIVALCCAGPAPLHAQYVISRLASGINGPTGMAADKAGNVYTAEAGAPFTIRQVNPSGVMTIFAGTGTNFYGIGDPATSVGLTNPVAVAVDLSGNVYISQGGGAPILRVTGGIVYQVTQTPGDYDGLAADTMGNVFYGTTFYPGTSQPEVYKTAAVASQPNDGSPVIGGSHGCTIGAMWDPYGLATDAAGNLYVADAYCNVIWKVTPSGTITVAAGVAGPAGGPLGDGGPATAAHLFQPRGVAVDANGSIYIADSGSYRIRQVNPAGIIKTIAGNGNSAPPSNAGCATSAGTTNVDAATVPLSGVWGIAVGPQGVYFSDHDLGVVCQLVVRTLLWSWGDNSAGELGNGANTGSNTPQRVGLTDVSAIAAGGGHSLALASDGTAWSWGLNDDGELGNGTNTASNVPVQVSNLAGSVAIAAGSFSSMALRMDGTVWDWGDNGFGQLGNGTTTSSSVPVEVSGLTGVTAIAAGDYHSLALKSDGTVAGWGINESGQLGNGSTGSTTTPVSAMGLTGVTAIAGGTDHSLALKSDGTVWAWGYGGDGELGNGTSGHGIFSSTPVQVSGLTGVMAIAAGNFYSLALKSDGTVWAWGYGADGELGNGTSGYGIFSSTPVQVSGLTGVMAIASGNVDGLALKSDGTVWAWGDNTSGELGNGTNTASNVPVQVSGLGGISAIAAAGTEAWEPQNLALMALSPTGGVISEALGIYPSVDDLNADGQINIVDIQLDIERSLGWLSSGKPPTASQKSIVPKAPTHTPFHPDIPAASAPSPIASLNFVPPTARSARGVDGQPVVAPGSWASIIGAGFVTGGSFDWSESLAAGSLPKSLDGITVAVAGHAAYLSYARPEQVSLLVPDVGFGLVPVTVTTPAGTSAPVTVQVQPYSPAFFPWPDNQPVATHIDSSPAVKNETWHNSYTVPARSGEVIALWGTGFGPAIPPAPDGVPIPSSPAYKTVSPVTVTIGGVPALVRSSVLAPGLAGVYQLQVEIPRGLPDGDYSVIASVNGLSTLPVMLTIHE